MATPMFIPPWLTNLPNPATFYERGVQIGQQQAAQQAAQQQAMLSAQREAVKEQVDQAYLQLKTDEAARKYAAQDKFNRLLQQNVDPAQALLQVGPELGSAMAPVVQMLKAQQMTPFQQAQTQRYQQELELKRQELEQKKEGKDYGDIQTLDLGGGYRAAMRAGSPGFHVIPPKSDKTITPNVAASILQKIPELDITLGTTGTTNSLATTLAPDLLKIVKGAPSGSKRFKYDQRTGKVAPIQADSETTSDSTPEPDQTDEQD